MAARLVAAVWPVWALELEVGPAGVSRAAHLAGPALRNATAHIAVGAAGVDAGFIALGQNATVRGATCNSADANGPIPPEEAQCNDWWVLQVGGFSAGQAIGPGGAMYMFLFSSPTLKRTFRVGMTMYGLQASTGTVGGSIGGSFGDLCDPNARPKPGCLLFSMKKTARGITSSGLDGAFGRFSSAGGGYKGYQRGMTFVSAFKWSWSGGENFFVGRDVSGWSLGSPGMGGLIGLCYWKYLGMLDSYLDPIGGSPEQPVEVGKQRTELKRQGEAGTGLHGEDTGVPEVMDCEELRKRKAEQGMVMVEYVPGPPEQKNPDYVSDRDIEMCEKLNCPMPMTPEACLSQKSSYFAVLENDPAIKERTSIPEKKPAGWCIPDSPQNGCNPCDFEGHCGNFGDHAKMAYCRADPTTSNSACQFDADGIGMPVRTRSGGIQPAATAPAATAPAAEKKPSLAAALLALAAVC